MVQFIPITLKIHEALRQLFNGECFALVGGSFGIRLSSLGNKSL